MHTLHKMKTLIIIPTYNEKNNISMLLRRITEMAPEVDILVVDDNSPDGTALEVKNFVTGTRANIQLIERIGIRGLGTAYKTGFQYGLERNYDIFVTMDADLSHNPVHLPAILSAVRHYDLVIGSRHIRDGGIINWPFRRILLSWLANKFARLVLGVKGHDLTSGYRAYRRTILETIDLDAVRSNGYSFLVEMFYLAQCSHARICEVPIIFFDRTVGKSKISDREIYLGALTLLRLRWDSYFHKP